MTPASSTLFLTRSWLYKISPMARFGISSINICKSPSPDGRSISIESNLLLRNKCSKKKADRWNRRNRVSLKKRRRWESNRRKKRWSISNNSKKKEAKRVIRCCKWMKRMWGCMGNYWMRKTKRSTITRRTRKRTTNWRTWRTDSRLSLSSKMR